MSRRINRHNNQIYINAVIVANNLKYTLINQNILPPNCSLMMRPQVTIPDTNIFITFNNPESNHTGHVMISQLIDIDTPVDGLHMLCAVDSFNGYFIEITVLNVEEMLEVIEFCQTILAYQPNNQRFLEFVRVPNHMLNHWCVPLHVRQQNISHIEEEEDPVNI